MKKLRLNFYLLSIAFASLTFMLPVRASADAMVLACNEANVAVGMSLRVYGFGWEKRSLAPNECQNVRVSGINILFDLATLWHGANLRLGPQPGGEDIFCEWKVDFGTTTWQRYAIRLEESAVACIFKPTH